MNLFSKTSKKFLESSIRSDEKIIELLLIKYEKTGDENCLKKIQKRKDSIAKTKERIRKFTR